MTKTATATSPARLPFIASDTYEGRWSCPAGKCRGENWTAEELHAYLPAGQESVIWTSFGHVRGVEMFGRDRVIADAEGIAFYTSEGALIMTMSLGQGRTVRMLVR